MSSEDEYQDEDPRLEEILRLLGLGLTIVDVAKRMQIHRCTVYRILDRHDISRERFTPTTDAELEAAYFEIKEDHPNVGQVMLAGHFRRKGIYVARSRVRALLHRHDREGIEERTQTAIKRREYFVPCPGHIWHMDGDHKLVRWKFVIHGAVDGYSRHIMFMRCSTNNKSVTVRALFDEATTSYAWPLRIRSDHGGENVLVWDAIMSHWRKEESVVTGASVHNERIERMWRDVNRLIANQFYNLFYEMEDAEELNPLNSSDLQCLHYVFLPLINRVLDEHVDSHNLHGLSTEASYTPNQLYVLNQHLFELHKDLWTTLGSEAEATAVEVPEGYMGLGDEELQWQERPPADRNNIPHVQVDEPRVRLPQDLKQRIQDIIQAQRITLRNARHVYNEVAQAVGDYFHNL